MFEIDAIAAEEARSPNVVSLTAGWRQHGEYSALLAGSSSEWDTGAVPKTVDIHYSPVLDPLDRFQPVQTLVNSLSRPLANACMFMNSRVVTCKFLSVQQDAWRQMRVPKLHLIRYPGNVAFIDAPMHSWYIQRDTAYSNWSNDKSGASMLRLIGK